MAFGMTIRRALSTTSCDQRFHDFESLVNCIRPESRFTTRTPNVRKVCTGVWRLDSGLRHTSIHSHTQHTDSRATRLERTSLAHTDSVAPIVCLSAHSKTRPARFLLTHHHPSSCLTILSLASRHSTPHSCSSPFRRLSTLTSPPTGSPSPRSPSRFLSRHLLEPWYSGRRACAAGKHHAETHPRVGVEAGRRNLLQRIVLIGTRRHARDDRG